MRFCSRALAAVLVAAAGPAAAQDPPEWSQPQAPFHILGGIYYVGSKGLAAYLVKTSRGLVLLDGTLAENVPQIERNIKTLGFRTTDIKLLLNTHAHSDHAAGLARLKADSGARMLASAGERAALESGRPPSITNYGLITFPPVKVDAALADGVPVRLGNTALTPLFTPGHTPGCTSWIMTVVQQDHKLTVIFPCSLTVAGNRLVGNSGYPGIVTDYRRSFDRIRGVHADVVLPAHPEQADVLGRHARQVAGATGAYIAPALLQTLVSDSKAGFEAELAKQQAAQRQKP
jgi:metallo-beta-lactamase class B